MKIIIENSDVFPYIFKCSVFKIKSWINMKMRKPILLIFAFFTIFTLLMLASNVFAEEHNPIIKIYDSTFTTETDFFSTCPVTVGIKTYSAVGPYDVILEKPDGTNITLATGVTAGVWHSFTYTCYQTGWWKAKAGSATIPFAIGSFLVIFEVPLGVLIALTACFAGLGVKRLRRTGKEKL